MTSATNNSQGKETMEDADNTPRPPKSPPSYPAGPPDGPPLVTSSGKSGYFKIYKKGQGYWTRMGTVAGVVLVGLLVGRFISDERNTFGLSITGSYIAIAVFGLIYAAIMFSVLNKPSNVDFLIATDSEMKRVNWTSTTDLMGSTKVVIGFMFIMACLLFFYDLFFQTLFWLIGVLKTPPPFFPDKH
jgi:preprotein translocase SecE subunit